MMLTDSSSVSSGRNGNNILQIVGKMGGRIRSKGDNHERDSSTPSNQGHMEGNFMSKNSVKKNADVIRASSLGESTNSSSSSSSNKMETDNTDRIPSHHAKLSLLTIQNALHMGARTQIQLCPPKLREELIKSLKSRKQKHKKSMSGPRRGMLIRSASVPISSISKSEDIVSFEKWVGEARLEEYDKEEDEILNNAKKYSTVNLDEEVASSGDEDGMDTPWEEDELSNRSTSGLSPSGGSSKSSLVDVPDKYIPLNLRKIKWFDSITTSDRADARQYLKGEMASMKQRSMFAVTRHIDDRPIRESKKISSDHSKGHGNVKYETSSMIANDKVGKLPSKMTPKLAAALVLESLALNRVESVEGMARCYNAIVTTGTALLEAQQSDYSSERGNGKESTTNDGVEKSEQRKPSLSEMKIDLFLLLKVTLEQTSGEVILGLARLRKLCVTKRYQRRFVQRVAPYLVRPPCASLWCLRHLEDMKAIFCATEMILDSAFDIFPPGWHVVRNNILAESKIKENLTSVAERLKQLSATQPLDDLIKNIGTHKRVAGFQNIPATTKDANEEILLVDRHIRQSINSLFSKDWSVQKREKPPHAHSQQEQGENRSHDSPTVAPSPTHNNIKLLLSPARLATTHNYEFDHDTRSQAANVKNDGLKASNGIVSDGGISPPMTPKYNHEQNTSNYYPPSPSTSPKKFMPDFITSSPGKKQTLSPNSGYDSVASSNITIQHFTMTPEDRRKTVAATRAIRQQIVRFEEAFQKIHGRKPRGPRERAPLLSTYAQYRDWKRAIRADAACRIQAFLRGAMTRRHMKPFIQPPYIPDVFEAENGSAIEVHPQTPLQNARDENETPQTPKEDLEAFKLQKRELKELLKAYDRDWYRRTGRMPVKAEKEPIRNLYEQYNTLKSKIREIEVRLGGTADSSPTNSDVPTPQETTMATSDSVLNPVAVITPPHISRVLDDSPNPSQQHDYENHSMSSDLSHLLNEKQSLHRLLRNYEKDFSRKNGRQVSCFEDIRPVARQYRKYKEIKKAIATRQGAIPSPYLEDRDRYE